MYKIAIGAVVFLALLASCTSFPTPQSDTDSLVVANLVLDFPDGFFDRGPRTLERNVRVRFENTANGQIGTMRTSDGYVSFLARDGGEYRLVGYEYEETVADVTYSGSLDLDIPFSVKQGTVTYLGDINVVYGLPERSGQQSRGSRSTRFYEFEISVSVVNNTAGVEDYLAAEDVESAWSGYRIISFTPDEPAQ